DQTIRSHCEGVAELINLGGKVIIPGLIEAHIHLEQYALGLQKVDCETPSLWECLERVAVLARSTPPGSWILGHGWNQNDWDGGFGTAGDLDAVAPQNPVYLTAKSLHAAWANSAALGLAHIDQDTADPLDGRLGRDENGNPDGILYESAMELVSQLVPVPDETMVAEAIGAALPGLWRMGLTGVHDFDRRRCLLALQILKERGDLNLRVLKSIPLEDMSYAISLGLHSGFGDDFLRIGQVKLFSDGALGPRTAAMLGSYTGEPDNQGMLFLDTEELVEYGRQAVDNGLALAVHAIGDRANHEVLNAFARLRERERSCAGNAIFGRNCTLRHRIEHVQLIHPNDAPRLGALGVIASMQPIHATSDMDMAEHYWGERAELSYAWRTQLDHGAILAFGSDAPVETPNPFAGLHAAVTRRRPDGRPAENGWYPEQRLGFKEALRAYTSGGAYAAGMEDRLGKLAPGYLADLLVLDIDPFECEPDQLLEIQPQMVMVGGTWVV
ncbi:amidohydrolase, partial [Chloroflexota bacterium]